MTAEHHTITNIPDELQRKIASFLPPADAVKLAQTSTSLERSLSLSSPTPRIRLPGIQDVPPSDDDPHQGPQIPVSYPTRTHSITLQCMQWCQEESHLYVVGFPRGSNKCEMETKRFQEGRIVAESLVEVDKVARRRIVFCPRPEEDYFLWYRGQGVQTGRILVYMLIFDVQKRVLDQEYRNEDKESSMVWNFDSDSSLMWQIGR